MRLPDFIIPGFQKCGTTALRQNLNQHPEIDMPKCDDILCNTDQEMNFFVKHANFHKMPADEALLWYKSRFKTEAKFCGEKSPNYTLIPEFSAARMHEIVPNVKLIFSFRNPIDRCYSAYNHYSQAFNDKQAWISNVNWSPDKSFLWNLENKKGIRENTNYAGTLKSYAKFFSPDKTLLIIQERLQKPAYEIKSHYKNNEIINEGQEEYDRIFNFLGASSFKIKNRIVHARSKKQLSSIEREAAYQILSKEFEAFFEIYGQTVPEWKQDLN